MMSFVGTSTTGHHIGRTGIVGHLQGGEEVARKARVRISVVRIPRGVVRRKTRGVGLAMGMVLIVLWKWKMRRVMKQSRTCKHKHPGRRGAGSLVCSSSDSIPLISFLCIDSVQPPPESDEEEGGEDEQDDKEDNDEQGMQDGGQ
jgi:hypothetical protein